MRLKNYEDAIQCCKKVLEKEPQNIKALYRKAQAQAGEKDFEGSLATLKHAHGTCFEIFVLTFLEIEPANQEIKTYYTKVQQMDKAHKQKQAAVLANMFA